MESRIQRLFLAGLLAVAGQLAYAESAEPLLEEELVAVAAAQNDAAVETAKPTRKKRGAKPEEIELEPLLVREEERRTVEVDEIDTEDFEVGVFGGVMSIEDFGSNSVVGVRAAYHVTEDFFVEATYGQSELGETSFERLSGGVRLLTDEERELTYYNASIGWNVLPGEGFIGRWAFKGALYLIAGVGSTEFGGDDRFTVSGGFGYRFIANDWLAVHLDVRDHVFDTDLLGAEETKHNVEFSGGLTIFF